MIWFIVEISVLLLAAAFFVLYRKTIRPLNIIGNGMDLLKEQDFSSRLGYVGQKDADKVVDIFNKMMEQLRNERLHLREQNQFLDLLIASSPVGVVILDFDERIMQVNPSGYKLFNLLPDNPAATGTGPAPVGDSISAPMLGRSLDEFPPLGVKLAALNKGESGIIRLSDASVYKCTCSTFMEKGFYHKFYLVEQMTQEVLMAEKKAYEKVIRTIAHEVNNSMAGIGSTLDTVLSILEPSQDTADEDGTEPGTTLADTEAVAGMLDMACERCTSLSNFITSYADVVKIPQPLLKAVRINLFFRNQLRFFEALCAGKEIKITLTLSDADPVLFMDSILMEQVMLNIVKNSVESIGETRGKIEITTFSDGRIEIADNGKGISPETADKLFTPFFSTKPNGQGIGLIFIRDVLQKHAFRFSLRTGSDGITRFEISR